MQAEPFELITERLGPLPLLNHFCAKLGVDDLLDRFVPTTDPRCRLAWGKALGVLLRSLLVEREPIYRQGETVSTFAAEAFGLAPEQLSALRDDQLGRALDRLFDADRATVLTRLVVASVERFGLALDEIHNDSTSVRLCGQYRHASGRSIRGRRAPWVTYGFSKDHRPDLKQLLLVLTTSSDGTVPIGFRTADGNTEDTTTHLQTWEALCKACGRTDFLYVADSKLCVSDLLETIDRRGGRLITVLPRSRREDAEFRASLERHEPAWELVVDRRHPRRKYAPRDRWWVVRAPLPSIEGLPIVWVKSSLLALAQHRSRHARIVAATEKLAALDQVLLTGRGRKPKTPGAIHKRIAAIVGHLHVRRYLDVRLRAEAEHHFLQTRRGRPGPDSHYRRETRHRFRIDWSVNQQAVAYDQRSDGMYPLLTNDRSLSAPQVFEAHKRQPALEKRFAQLKSRLEIAPVLLKNEARIEAFFFVYFLALLVAGLIERQLRSAMAAGAIPALSLYPEQRPCKRPTYEQILRLFALTERHTLLRHGNIEQVFHPRLTALQRQVLDLLDVPIRAYGPSH